MPPVSRLGAALMRGSFFAFLLQPWLRPLIPVVQHAALPVACVLFFGETIRTHWQCEDKKDSSSVTCNVVALAAQASPGGVYRLSNFAVSEGVLEK
jgi:hypothetical protein